MISPRVSPEAKSFHSHSAAVIYPGSRVFNPDPGYLAWIRGVFSLDLPRICSPSISSRLDKRKVFSLVCFYSFVLQLSPSSVKGSKSIFNDTTEKSAAARGWLRPHISGP